MTTWKSRTGEAVAIVLSILAAFAIQAWWEGLREGQAEAMALDGLADDFPAFVTHLRQKRDEHLRRIEAADHLLAATGPLARLEDRDQLVLDLAETKNLNPISLIEGTLRSLLQSSGLGLLSDEGLRQALSAWTQEVAEVQGRWDWAMIAVTEWETYLVSRVPLRAIDSNVAGGDLRTSPPPAGSAFPLELEAILREVEFENHVHRQRQASQVVVQQLDLLDQAAQRIIELLAIPPN